MPIIRRSVLLGGFAVLLGASVLGSAAGVTPTSPNKDQTIGKSSPQPVPEEPATSGSSTEPLSDKLDRSGGIIRPPSGVDPGITQAPPAVSSKSTPIIPPPGAPGGKRGINPK